MVHTRISGRLFKEVEREQGKAVVSRLPDDLPTLFLVPEDDRVVQSPVTFAYARGIAGSNIQLEILKGRRHEPLNDLGRDEVYRMVIDWLAEKVADAGIHRRSDQGPT
jgi:alpha-beta hydrolase superfamily lysophospholipase